MSELGDRLADVRVEWTALREERVWAGVRPRRRRRAVGRLALACALATTAAIAGVVATRPAAAPGSRVAGPAAPPAPSAPRSPVAPAPISPAALPPVSAPSPAQVARKPDAKPDAKPNAKVEAMHPVFAGSRSEQHAKAATWRELARDGEYDRAYAAVDQVGDQTEDLLMVADVMRLSHHPAEAVEPLRRVVREHAGDPRASLAAFTLGRVLLEELGQPRDAADAFADAIRLAPDGPMVEDAIAREVEALSRAGEPTAAHQLADDYVHRFPAGRKLRSVRRFGGLE